MTSKKQWLGFFLIFLAAIVLRLGEYSQLEASLGTGDTESYLQASEIDFPTLTFFTSGRSATLPLIFKIFSPEQGYQLTWISEPATAGGGRMPANQAGFEPIVAFQIAMSIIGWGALALVVFHHLTHTIVKPVTAALILLFGFSPQMANWDSLLMSESLSFSLYALLVALVVELVFSLSRRPPKATWKIWGIVAGLFLVTAGWVFSRDTNIYLLLLSVAALCLLLFFSVWRKIVPLAPVIVLTGLMIGLAWFQQTTFRASQRWLLPLLNNMTTNVFPYPSRVDFFASKGMPVSPELLSISGSAEYNSIYEQEDFIAWAKEAGLTAYSEFLLRTPLWAMQSIYSDLEDSFALNEQWYFEDSYSGHPGWLIPIGDFLHPISSSVLFLDVLLTFLVIGLVWRIRTNEALAWAVIAVWLLTNSFLLLVTGYLGEVRSVQRHALTGTVPLRFLLWLLLAIVADLSLTKGQDISLRAVDERQTT